MTRTLLLVGMAALTVGCSTVRFRVPAAEVRRLAEMPPAERGHEVRVIPWDTPPDSARAMYQPAMVEETGGGGGVFVDVSVPVGPLPLGHPRAHGFQSTAHSTMAPRSNPGSFRGGPVARAPGGGPSPSSWRGSPTGGHAPASLPRPGPSAPHRSSFPSSSGGHHHGGGGASAAVAGAVAVVGIIALVAALSASDQADERSEFARTYDGWVTAGRDQPLHVVYQNGTEREIPLAQLTPAVIAGIQYAYLDETDGKVLPLRQPFAGPPPSAPAPPAPPPARLPPPPDTGAPENPQDAPPLPMVPPGFNDNRNTPPPLS